MTALDTTSRLLASAGITGGLFALPLVLATAWQGGLPDLEVEATVAPTVALAAVPLTLSPSEATADFGADDGELSDDDGQSFHGSSPAGTGAPVAGDSARPRQTVASSRRIGTARHGVTPATPEPAAQKKKKRRKRVCETPNPGIERDGPTLWSVERDIVDAYAKKPGTLNDLGWVQRHEGTSGKADGFRVGGIRCGNDLHAAGIRNGDVVHSVNGRPVRNIPEALWAYAKAKKADRVEVEITRNGSKRTLSFKMV